MINIKSAFKSLKKDQRGVSTLEYALLAAGALFLGIFAWNTIGVGTRTKLQSVGTQISGAGSIPTTNATP